MIWLALAKLFLAFAASAVAYAREKQLLDAGAAREIARNMEATNALLDKARAARDAAVADLDRRGGVPDDRDPNLRD